MKICKKEELSGHLVDMRERTRHSEAQVKQCTKDLCLLLKGAQKCSLQAV